MNVLYKAPRHIIAWCRFKYVMRRHLPPAWPDDIRFVLTRKRRLKPRLEHFGGAGGYGICYEWLGVGLKFTKLT